MTTAWTLPSTITQYSEPGGEQAHISWVEVDNFYGLKSLDGKSTRTVTDLLHIAREPKHDLTQKTYYLKLTGFNFSNLPTTLQGIEMQLSINRYGRITDDTVQLCLGDNLVGENQASAELNVKKIYGGQQILWNSNLNMSDIQDSTFGIVLRFQSHPQWPHRSSPLIDAVELRIH